MLKKYAESINPTMQIGTMVSDVNVYPASSKPDDIVLAFKKNRMEYYYTDVQFFGEYPQYALNYFKENNAAATRITSLFADSHSPF